MTLYAGAVRVSGVPPFTFVFSLNGTPLQASTDSRIVATMPGTNTMYETDAIGESSLMEQTARLMVELEAGSWGCSAPSRSTRRA